MEFKKYEKGFNLSLKICNKYDELSNLYMMGMYNSDKYNSCLNDIKVLISNEKYIYDDLSFLEAADYFNVLSNLKFKDFSSVGIDNISVFKRYYLNIRSRVNLNNGNDLENLFMDDKLSGMITIETLRKTYNSILNVSTENINEVKFKNKLFNIFNACIINICSLYQYSEDYGLRYKYDISSIPVFNIKDEFDNNDYDRTNLLEYAKSDISELLNFSDFENTPENVFLMLYISSKIDVYLDLFNQKELRELNEYYNSVRNSYKDSFMDNTIRNKFIKKKNN